VVTLFFWLNKLLLLYMVSYARLLDILDILFLSCIFTFFYSLFSIFGLTRVSFIINTVLYVYFLHKED